MARHDIAEWSAKLTQEERTENARKAGLASAEKKLRYKTQRELMKQALLCAPEDPKIAEALRTLGLDATYASALAIAQIRKGADGDTEAFRAVRDTIGEKPTEAYQLAVSDKPIKALDLSGMTDDELEALADGLDP